MLYEKLIWWIGWILTSVKLIQSKLRRVWCMYLARVYVLDVQFKMSPTFGKSITASFMMKSWALKKSLNIGWKCTCVYI